MLKALYYIFYPPRFVRDMRSFRVSEFSVFVLFFVGLLLHYYWYREVPMLRHEVLFGVLFCAFAYGLYVLYKVSWMPYLTLYLSISAIASVWSYVAESLLYALQLHFGSEPGLDGLIAGYVLWSLIYIVLFHAICHDMEGRRNDGMVVVRRA